MEEIKGRARGIALALCVSGFIPALIAGAATSCDAVLDAAPALAALAVAAGLAKVWRLSC